MLTGTAVTGIAPKGDFDKTLEIQQNIIKAVNDEDDSEVGRILALHSEFDVDIFVGDEPLIILAAKSSNLDVFIMLIQKSKKPAACDKFGMNVIHHLVLSSHKHCCYQFSMDAALIEAIKRDVPFTQENNSGDIALIKLFERDFFKYCENSRALALAKISKQELRALKVNGINLINYIDEHYSRFSLQGFECLIKAGFNFSQKTMLEMTLQESLYAQLGLVQNMSVQQQQQFLMNLDGTTFSHFNDFKSYIYDITRLIDKHTLHLDEYEAVNVLPSYSQVTREKANDETKGDRLLNRRRSVSITEMDQLSPTEYLPQTEYLPYKDEPEPERQRKLAQDANPLTWSEQIFSLPPPTKSRWVSTPNLSESGNGSENAYGMATLKLQSFKGAATTFLMKINNKLHGKASKPSLVLVENMEIGGITIFSGHVGEFRTNYLPLLDAHKKEQPHKKLRSASVVKNVPRAQRQYTPVTKAQVEQREEFKEQIVQKMKLSAKFAHRRSTVSPLRPAESAAFRVGSFDSDSTFESVFPTGRSSISSEHSINLPMETCESSACLAVTNTFLKLFDAQKCLRRASVFIPTITTPEMTHELKKQRETAIESARELKSVTGSLTGVGRLKVIADELKGVREHAMSGIANATDDYTEWLQRLDVESHMDCESTTVFHGIELAASVLTQIDSIRQLKVKNIKDIVEPISGLVSGTIGVGAASTEMVAHFSEGSISEAVGDASASLEIIGALKDGMIKIIDLIKALSHSGSLTQSEHFAPTDFKKTQYYLGEGLSYAKKFASISKKFLSAAKKIIDIVGSNSGMIGEAVPGLGLVVNLIHIVEQIQKLTTNVPLYMQLSEMKLRAKVLLNEMDQTTKIIKANGKTNTVELKVFLALSPEIENELNDEIIDPDAIDEVRRYSFVREMKSVNLDRIRNECFSIGLHVSKTCANITELSVVAEEVAIALTVTNAVIEIGKEAVEGGVQKINNLVQNDHSAKHKHEALCEHIEILFDLTATVYNKNIHLVDSELFSRQCAEIDILFKSTGLPFKRFLKLLQSDESKAIRALYRAMKNRK
ncbi:hypothetical protein D5R81_10860 [Parashewanella spongiae]|uniref:Ankyrin repeat domain-containing protein n=1 Tax=Parashewanella spongiae TaxID=342950 RepID=A0A3A6TPK7_9GAMM|nr:hypothetical protein [Parashewanella spongiae]MCL1078507.1 hypothetical protein [Parashewanella spongiae]RJY14700.1 hypothetical protein D5R81_10860 [Parashewanella spongiae]